MGKNVESGGEPVSRWKEIVFIVLLVALLRVAQFEVSHTPGVVSPLSEFSAQSVLRMLPDIFAS